MWKMAFHVWSRHPTLFSLQASWEYIAWQYSISRLWRKIAGPQNNIKTKQPNQWSFMDTFSSALFTALLQTPIPDKMHHLWAFTVNVSEFLLHVVTVILETGAKNSLQNQWHVSCFTQPNFIMKLSCISSWAKGNTKKAFFVKWQSFKGCLYSNLHVSAVNLLLTGTQERRQCTLMLSSKQTFFQPGVFL